MSMRFKIFQSVPYTDSKGITYRNHKVFIKNKPYWISEKDFVNHPELLIIRNENLELKVPTESYYSYVKNTNKKGQYFLIIPTESVDNEMTMEMDPKPLILGKGNIIKNKNLKALTVEKSDKSEVKTKAYSKESLKKKEVALLGEPFCNHPPGSYKITIKFKDGVINTFYILRTRENINVRAVNDRSEEKILSGDQLELFTSGKFAPYMLAGDSVENLIFEISSLGEYQESGGSLGVIEKEEIKKVENTKLKSAKRDKSIKQEVQSHKDNSVTILEDFMDVVDVFTEEIDKIEPESKSETSIGNKNTPSSSFKRLLANARESNQTDPYNILPEEFLDVNDLFPEESDNNINEPSASQTTLKELFGNPKNQQKTPLDTKIQFINGLVAMASREKINNRLRERLFNLVSKELDGQKGREDKIFEEINNIKKILLQSQTVPPPTSDTGDLPEYISPNDLYKFLLEYNTDPILKYTCHEIQDESVIDTIVALSQNTKYKYTDHLTIIRNAYKSLTKKHKVNKRIWSLMNNYINGPNEWSSDNIPINWSSPEIIEWSFNNPEKVPNPGGTLVHKTKNKGFTFSKPIYSGLTGEKITSFSQLIIHFKHMFHLKGDHSLRTVIEKINNTESFKEHIDFKFSETHFWNNLELFTDVDKLTQAYKDILKMILEASKMKDGDKPVVGLEYYEKNSKIYFSIHHLNSVYQKTLTNTVERIGESQSNLIKTKINGLCDLFLKADFGHDIFALVNLWDGNERTSISIPEFMGVQYILKF